MRPSFFGACLHGITQCVFFSIIGWCFQVGVARADPKRVARAMRSASDAAISMKGKGAAQALLATEFDGSRISGIQGPKDVDWTWAAQTSRSDQHINIDAERCHEAKTPHEISLMQCSQPVMTSRSTGADPALYHEIKLAVMDRYESLSPSCEPTHCERAEFAGVVLRFAVNDFMDFNIHDGTGGSDGCIDFEDPENAGIKQTICGEGEFGKGAILNSIYEHFCGAVSYADFVVIAAEAVMIRSRPDFSAETRTSPSLSFDFTFGRTTATSCPRVQGKTDLPNPEHGCKVVDEVFNERMGLNSWRASAALMGVLGWMRKESGGHEGSWSEASVGRTFDNDYYQSMTVGWKAVKGIGGNPNKNGWMRADNGPRELFLDTDLCLYQGGFESFAKTANDACHWSVIKNGPTSNHNFCLLSSGQIDTDRFPARGCCGMSAGNDHQDRLQPDTRVDFFDTGAGPAAEDIIDFALDEDSWLTEFKKAWAHVTENNLKVNTKSINDLDGSDDTTTIRAASDNDQDLNADIDVQSQWTWETTVFAILLGTGATSGLTLLITIVGVGVCMMMKQSSKRQEPEEPLAS